MMLPARNMSWVSSADSSTGAIVGRPSTIEVKSAPLTISGRV